MKLNIAYLLLLLVISPNLYGAESALALQDPQGESSERAFAGQTVKGFTEVINQWSQKTIPVEYVETGKGWVDREEFVNKEIESLVIFGSVHDVHKPTIADAEKNAKTLSIDRPLCAYHFVKSHYFSPSVNTPLRKDAEKIFGGQSTKIKQFKKAQVERRLGKHVTVAPKSTPSDFFDETSKAGYRSQLLQGLAATQEDYKESKDNGALKRSLVVLSALSHELEKSTKALASRDKQFNAKKAQAEALKAEIAAFNLPMSNELVFHMNALIDVHQSENRYHQPQNPDSIDQTIDCIFNAGNDEFALQKQSFATVKKDGSEHAVNFGPFMKKDGRLPVEECGLQARKIYDAWYTLHGEPTDATKLRTLHNDLMAKRAELKEEKLVDRKLFIQNQIEILQEARDDAFVKIRTQLFEAAKLLTSKDLAIYNTIAYNRIRLAFAEGYLADEETAIASEKKLIADISAAMAAGIDDKGKQEA